MERIDYNGNSYFIRKELMQLLVLQLLKTRESVNARTELLCENAETVLVIATAKVLKQRG